MADVDDEFLALVGGDESSDEEFNQAEDGDDNASRVGSGSPFPDDNSKKLASGKKSKRGGQDYSDEEEEGEAYVTNCSFFPSFMRLIESGTCTCLTPYLPIH